MLFRSDIAGRKYNLEDIDERIKFMEEAVAIIDTSSAKGSISVNSSGNKEVTAGGLVGKLGRNNVMANAWTDMDVTAISQGGNASAISGGIAAVSGVQSVLTNVSSFGDIYASAPLSNQRASGPPSRSPRRR